MVELDFQHEAADYIRRASRIRMSAPATVPLSLQIIALVWIAICVVNTIVMAVQTIRTPQKMWIMNLVWPITGLYLGPFAYYLYLSSLPVSQKKPMSGEMKRIVERHKQDSPTWLQNSIAVFHCGAGCSIGDSIAELLVPALALSFAGEFGTKLIVDFLFAYILGIAFQYFTIVPMRGLSFSRGLLAAVRADTISIALFEVGMFAWMAISHFWLFPAPHLKPNMPAFWFMMQIAMIAGTATALPANAWLIRKGWKEKMPQIDPKQMRSDMHGEQETPRLDRVA